MRLPRTEVIEGYPAELSRFEQQIRALNDAQWAASTRCAGWAVADVAAHVVGTLAAIVDGRTEELAEPGHVERQVDERRGRTSSELADELVKVADQAQSLLAVFDDESWLAPAPGGVAPTVGAGVEALWYDTWVHGDDIRSALGQPATAGPGLRVSVAHLADILTERGWGPATLALDGVEEFAVGSGGGRRVTGDARQFVLAATGRLDPSAIGLDDSVNVYAD